MQAIANDMLTINQQESLGNNNNNNNMQSTVQRQPITEEYVQLWIQQLEQWTNIFYNNPNVQDEHMWKEAEVKLVQFQKIHEPIELCTEIIKKSRNSLVLYQATLCLKNTIANEFKKFDIKELFKLFQFLYEFLCSQSLENEMSVNETTALIGAMVLKRIASEKPMLLSAYLMSLDINHVQNAGVEKEADKITHVITALCLHLKEPTESLSKKVASALMLSSLLSECQMTHRSTSLGIRVWKHLNARRLIETHLKTILGACLETINWAFTSNLLNPMSQACETQILFHLVGSLIQCVENSLSFNSTDTGCVSNGDRVLRVIQCRSINMFSISSELNDQRLKTLHEWCDFVMTPPVVQFLFNLYTSVKSMVKSTPGWAWPANLLKNCLNCLYYLSDIHTSMNNMDKDETYAGFVGNLMLGAVKIMDAEVQGIDDSFQIACLITSISMHTGETRDTISKIKTEHFISFLDAAQRFTCKVFTQVATTSKSDIEEEEEKTVDALLDFWYHLLKNIDSEIRWASTQQIQPKITFHMMTAYSRLIVENYISCHLHKPIGQLVPASDEIQEVDLDQADEQDDNILHAQQLVSFGLIARFDALHTAKILIELLSTRMSHFEALLTRCIGTTSTPDGVKDWEYINDDLHWLLLMLQHYLTQTGYGEIGFMCGEILDASVAYKADVQKTLEGFEKCDYNSPEVDPIVRLMIIALKLCQFEMGICQSGNLSWLSVQTNATLTTLLSRFCLTYLYPKESDYSVISENMNYCFGQDAPSAEKFLKFVIERTCCIILYMKADPHIVKKNVQLLIQLLMFHPNVKEVLSGAEEGSMIKTFISQMRPDNLTGFSPKVAKSIIKLATRLFAEEEEWDKLINLFKDKWTYIISCIQTSQHQTEIVANKFLEFCDFAMGVCEACDDDTSERLFEQLLVPIVDSLPSVIQAFVNFDRVPIAIFELLYNIVKLPMVNITTWESVAAKSFYDSCKVIIMAYANITVGKSRGAEEEDCEDIVALLTFTLEVMKRDWGNSWASCDEVVRASMEKISVIVKPEYLQFPPIRAMYYRLLVYLVDEDDRLANLSDTLLNTIVSSVLLALQSHFDKDVDSHVYTIIGIICRTIYLEKGNINRISERLSEYMMPVLPALFHSTISRGSFTINAETAELIAPAFFSMRCCFINEYRVLVKDLINSQDDQFAKSKIESLFENLENKIHKLALNRSSCREFITLFVPFLAELHNYTTIR